MAGFGIDEILSSSPETSEIWSFPNGCMAVGTPLRSCDSPNPTIEKGMINNLLVLLMQFVRWI
tara:strand:- start:15 stop:203 length:189 start_codon:yes stop_codon:yes gene_type:complete